MPRGAMVEVGCVGCEQHRKTVGFKVAGVWTQTKGMGNNDDAIRTALN